MKIESKFEIGDRVVLIGTVKQFLVEEDGRVFAKVEIGNTEKASIGVHEDLLAEFNPDARARSAGE